MLATKRPCWLQKDPGPITYANSPNSTCDTFGVLPIKHAPIPTHTIICSIYSAHMVFGLLSTHTFLNTQIIAAFTQHTHTHTHTHTTAAHMQHTLT